MGNNASVVPSGSTGKVILPDGTVQKFDKPMTVAELMIEFPQLAVIELESPTSRKMPRPLPADKKLDVRKVYVMVPMKQAKASTLSYEDVYRILSRSTDLMPGSAPMILGSKFLPLLSLVCAVGGEIGREKLVKGGEMKGKRREVVDVLEGLDMVVRRDYYMSRQTSCRNWKPSLDTIEEKNVEKKVSHWMFSKIK